MEYRPEDIIASKHGKKESRLVASHKGKLLEIASLCMTSSGSFVFCKIRSNSSTLSDSIRQSNPIQIVNPIRFNSSVLN